MSPERESWRRFLANLRNNMPAEAYELLMIKIGEDAHAEYMKPGTIPMPPPIQAQES